MFAEAQRLRDIPAVIINGRHDLICSPSTACGLHELLPKSRLEIVEGAGHSETETGITAALLKAVAEFE